MLNRIVLTEKDQIATLKVIDELKQNDIKSEMQVIANSLAESNMRKVTLDLENLQVISHDTHELLGLIIRHVRLQNIPISITGSTQFDPGILLAISEGRPQNVEQKKQEEVRFTIKPKYFSRYPTPFFSTEKEETVYQNVLPVIETEQTQADDAENQFYAEKPDDVEFVLQKNISEKYSLWLKLGWILLLSLTGIALTLMILLWPEYQSGKIHAIFLNDNKTQFAVKTGPAESVLIQEKSKSTLIQAVKQGELAAVKQFLATSVDLEKSDQNGYTSLMLAIKKQNTELVKLLAEHGANVGINDEFGDTPLVWASSMQNLPIVNLLLKHGADPDQGNFSPLMWAAFHGNLPMLKLFLKSGVNLNARTHEGWTALMWAAEKGNTEAIWELLKRGAGVNMHNNSGKTALILATRRGKIGTIGLLLNKGADPSVVDFAQKTAADYAMEFQREDVLQLLEKEVYLR